MKQVNVGDIKISNNLPFVLIAGPCAIESLNHAVFMSRSIKNITDKLDIPFIYKSSFDKANRTSISSKRGPGMEGGLKILSEMKKLVGCPVLTDVHETHQVALVADVADVIQIPAFLCRQTDLLVACGKTGKPINVKKGQFLSPEDMTNVIKKIESTGNENILLCERGTMFGYNNLVVDFRSIPILANSGYPVVMDATHSVQKPGGQGEISGGDRDFVPTIAKAGVANSVAAVFMECHQEPDSAPSDGPNSIKLSDLEDILTKLKEIDIIVKSW